MQKSRMFWLDGARGIAALCVLVFHVMGGDYWFLSNLYVAVDFFFVLSGFVLADSLNRLSNVLSIKKFALKRYIRIAPMLLATLIFSWTYDLALLVRSYLFDLETPKVNLALTTVLFSILLLQILYPPAVLVNYPVWSLSAEWIVNLFASCFQDKFKLRIILTSTTGCVLIWISALYDLETLNQFGRAFWGFSIGMLAFQYKVVLQKYVKLELFLSSLVIPLYFVAHKIEMLQSLVMVWPFTALILYLSRLEASLSIRPVLEFAGRYSYGFYLWHFPILGFVGLASSRINAFLQLNEIVKLMMILFVTASFTIFAVRVSLSYVESPLTRVALKKFDLSEPPK